MTEARRVLLVGATGLIGQAVARALSGRAAVIAAGIEGSDLFLDLFDPASIVAALESAGPLDAVVCAAGPGQISPLGNIGVEPLGQSILGAGVLGKLIGQTHLALAAIDRLRDAGSITLITGVTAAHPVPGFAPLSLANAGLEGFVRAAAIELPRGLRINAVSPGVLAGSPPAVLQMFAGHTPVTLDAVAAAFVSGIEGNMSGHVIPVWQ